MKNGGPAFPNATWDADIRSSVDGMSLRDWFAGMALQGRIASLSTHEARDSIIKACDVTGMKMQEVLASMAYTDADAMLAQREKERE